MRARIVGIGQETAGDDGVGLAVARALREYAADMDIDVQEIAEPSRLIPLLETHVPVVIVDAVVGRDRSAAGTGEPAESRVGLQQPGDVVVREPEGFEIKGAVPLSTHGIGVIEAIGLARTLSGAAVSPDIRIVGILIELPEPYRQALSPPVRLPCRWRWP